MKDIVFVIIVLLCSTGCKREPEVFKYDDNRLTTAWEENDSIYLKNWILHLDELDFADFATRINAYAYATNFLYGNIDPEGDVDARWTKPQIKVLRLNTGLVYNEYNKSCVFLNKVITQDDTYCLCLKYWRDTVLSDQDKDSLRKDLQAICNKVNNSPATLIQKHL